MGKVWEATQTWERLENRLGKVREGKVLHGKTLGRVWEEFLFIVQYLRPPSPLPGRAARGSASSAKITC